jgi:pimeloyl-ACP methyl ester carboxylesterase
MGALLAASLAAEHPDKVAKLIMISPGGFPIALTE